MVVHVMRRPDGRLALLCCGNGEVVMQMVRQLRRCSDINAMAPDAAKLQIGKLEQRRVRSDGENNMPGLMVVDVP